MENSLEKNSTQGLIGEIQEHFLDLDRNLYLGYLLGRVMDNLTDAVLEYQTCSFELAKVSCNNAQSLLREIPAFRIGVISQELDDYLAKLKSIADKIEKIIFS